LRGAKELAKETSFSQRASRIDGEIGFTFFPSAIFAIFAKSAVPSLIAVRPGWVSSMAARVDRILTTLTFYRIAKDRSPRRPLREIQRGPAARLAQQPP